MLHSQNPKEFGHTTFTNSCKLQTLLQSSLRTLVVLEFPKSYLSSLRFSNDHLGNRLRRYAQWQSRSGSGVFLGFKLQCHSRTLVPTKTSVPISGKKKKYKGALPSVLRSLDCNEDIEKVLNFYSGKFSPKEKTVILKEQGTWDRVLKVFDWMKTQEDYVPNVIHYNVVLRALGRAQKWDELRLCWVEMSRDGVLPTNNTYSMLIDVYRKAGLAKESLLWIKHMRSRGMFPDEVTMSTVVGVLKDAGEFDRADRFYKDWCVGKVRLEYFDFADLESDVGSNPVCLKNFLSTELFKTGGRSHPSIVAAELDKTEVRKPRLTATYNTLIDLYGKAGRLKDAADVFAEMLRFGVAPDVITFNTMIHICGSNGHLSEAKALLNKMEERVISPDTKTYNTFLSLYAEAGNIDAALRCYKKIRESGLFPDFVTHRAVLRILCKRQMIQDAEAVIREIEKSRVCIDENSIPVVVEMYVEEGLLEQARIFVEKCELDGGFSSKTYAAIMDIYAEKGLYAEAEAVFYRKMQSLGQKNGLLEYNVMIKAYGKAKLYDKAFSLFKGMRSLGTWPDECTYNSLIQMFAGGDLVDQAKDLLVDMQGAGLKPPCQTFSAVIASYIRIGNMSEGVCIFKDMEMAEVTPNEAVYGSLIDGFSEAGRIEEALHYYKLMEDNGITANQVILTSLIKAYGKAGYLEGAKEMYEKLKQLDEGPDVIALNSMINLYADFGIVSEARLIFDSLRQKGQADGVTYATMMQMYKNMGMLDEAIDMAAEMKQSGLLTDSASFGKVMSCYVTNGLLSNTVELLHEMMSRKIFLDQHVFKALFTVLKKGGIPSEAVMQLESAYQDGKSYAKEAVITCAFSVVGLHDLALKYCETFTKLASDLDSSAYNVAIYAHGASGKIDKALNFVMKMQDEGLQPDLVTYINLVLCYGQANMTEGVKRIYIRMKNGEIEANESLSNAIIDAYEVANRHDLAELVRQEMKFVFDTQRSDFESEGRQLSDSETVDNGPDEEN